jgi:hypothetical protein
VAASALPVVVAVAVSVPVRRVVAVRRSGEARAAVAAPVAVARRRVRSVVRWSVAAWSQVEACASPGVRADGGADDRWRARPQGQRRDRPPARGASLTDFAEKISVDAASLVQMLFRSARW